MNQQQQDHSCVKRNGKDYVSIPRPITTGTRQYQFFTNNIISATAEKVWIAPLYNLLRIDQVTQQPDIPFMQQKGTSAQQRTGNSIFIHRIDFEFSLREHEANIVPPEPAVINDNYVLKDPRVRVMVVQPKQMARILPTSLNATFPFFSSAGDANHPEPLSQPISNTSNEDYGMVGQPDPKKFDLEYDDLKNLQFSTSLGMENGSMTFIVRKRFDYDQDKLTSTGNIYLTDSDVFNSIPQIWFFTPAQQMASANVQYRLNMYCRIVFDNVV